MRAAVGWGIKSGVQRTARPTGCMLVLPQARNGCVPLALVTEAIADAHETARGVRLEFEQLSNFLGCQIVGHCFS